MRRRTADGMVDFDTVRDKNGNILYVVDHSERKRRLAIEILEVFG